jgi:anti-sigma regulatory factor (Ser/Thr protein kinase)
MRASEEFEPDPREVYGARRFVTKSLRTWGFDPGDVTLMVSELATNAVLHARSPFRVTLIQRGCRLRVEVFDDNSRLPTFALVPADANSGRGLTLIQALAGAWGVETHVETGKTIWFEVGISP